jgi:hypothetical protein
MARYYNDPVGFARTCIEWPEDAALTDYQADILQSLVDNTKVCVRSLHGAGKALLTRTSIPTPTGWMTMGDLRVGDQVLSEQGVPCNVVSVSPRWWGDTWRVSFSDGSSLVTHGNHEWKAIDVNRRPMGVGDWRDHWDSTFLVTTRHMAETLRTTCGQLRWRIPTTRPLSAPEAPLPIDPYLLGLWLGDGNTRDGRLTLNSEDLPEFEQWIGESHRNQEQRGCWSVWVKGLHKALRLNGLLNHKHIPMAYLRASEAQRRALVQGLMDSDGFHTRSSDGIDLCNKQLALDVCELFRSLGLVVRMAEGDAKLYGRVTSTRYRIAVRFDQCPFRLSRYTDTWTSRGSQASRHTGRTIVDVQRVSDEETVCITVDSPSHLFLAGDDFIPTHNTTTVSLAVIWFALTRDAAGVDWKCPTTAGAWRQLEQYLWPEIHRWARCLRWDVIGRPPFKRQELLRLNLNLRFGSAFAVASDIPANIEGVHADAVLYVFDESKAVTDATFDAAEGAFSGTGEAFALASSTPGEPVGRFYAIHARKPGMEDWTPMHVTLAAALKAGRVAQSWVDQRGLQWGTESALYANRVLGEFHSADEDGVIPLSWIEAAVERWYAHSEEYDNVQLGSTVLVDRVGMDVARFGGDETIASLWHEDRCLELRKWRMEDTAATTGHLVAILRANPNCSAIVDTDGLGAGVTDHARDQGFTVEAFHAAARTDKKDSSGELGFLNVRAAAWWTLREQLDPKESPTLELPDDSMLLSDLCAPHWKVTGRGLIQVEAKVDLKKRLGRSPDAADAVVMARWAERPRRRRRMTHVGREERLVSSDGWRGPDPALAGTRDGRR